MKKLLHVALLAMLSLGSILSASEISEKSLNKLMKLSGISKQMQEYPSIVKSGMTQAQSQSNSISPEKFTMMKKTVDEAYKPSKLIYIIKINIKNKLSQTDVNNLLKWYKSDIGKKITKAEEDSSTVEAYKYMLQNAEEIMKDKKKVFFANRIDKLLHVTEMVAQLQKNTTISIYSAMSKPTKSEITIFRSQLSSKRKEIEANSRRMVILSFAYSYRYISNEDLEKYIIFLKESSSKKFNDAAMKAMINSLNEAVSDMAYSFSDIIN